MRRPDGDARREGRIRPTKHRAPDGAGVRGRSATANGSESRGPRQARRRDATNARTGHARAASPPKPGGTREGEAITAGLRPEAVLVYCEDIHRAQSASREAGASVVGEGRGKRPPLAGEHGCGEAARTLTRHETLAGHETLENLQGIVSYAL